MNCKKCMRERRWVNVVGSSEDHHDACRRSPFFAVILDELVIETMYHAVKNA
ncbi:hypothetical protein B0F90DRAFT_1789237 [Multifurca ochricompacta]|uniref:Uncharacterized protein n=1 Tax=Multifurca ochricompacta TaxID=376703 RepID=A0AAD4LUP3_9AGAM|nr:hypothetical protein B0F90DRAFT_1789237 [Multifurca ochricompacta]